MLGAVDLDHEPLSRPEEVHLEPEQRDVHGGERDVVVAADPQELALALRPGFGERYRAIGKQSPERLEATATTSSRAEIVKPPAIQEDTELGLLEHAPGLAGAGQRGQVKDRPRGARHRDEAAPGGIDAIQMARAVNRDLAGSRARPAGDRHVDPALVARRNQAVKLRGAPMAEYGTLPGGHHCRHPAALLAHPPMAHGIDPAMEAMQVADLDPARDGRRADPGPEQLGASDHSVLHRRDPRDLGHWGGTCPYAGGTRYRCGHGPSLAGRSARVARSM